MVHYSNSVATANITAMSYPKSSPSPDGEDAVSVNFPTQSQMGLAEVLQMFCLSNRSGQITFRSGESYGFIYLQHGRVLHSMCGVIEGEEAIYRMLNWPAGGFSLDQDILPHKKTVTLTWEQLLFEGARRADGALTDSGSVMAVVTTIPVKSTRAKESQPKLTITVPDQGPYVHELGGEYTHLGRAPGNEIPLPYPSVSSRHCIFILSGPDVVLRDLNSSNGTLVNGEAITEVILSPGDVIQTGVVKIKFEPGVKRPKLIQTPPAEVRDNSELRKAPAGWIPSRTTAKLPQRSTMEASREVKDDSVFVKGQSAISYENLAKPEVAKSKKPLIILIVVVILILALLGAGYFYFAAHPH